MQGKNVGDDKYSEFFPSSFSSFVSGLRSYGFVGGRGEWGREMAGWMGRMG